MRILLGTSAPGGRTSTGGGVFVSGLASTLASAGEKVGLIWSGSEEPPADVCGEVELVPVKTSGSGMARVAQAALAGDRLAHKWNADVFHFVHEWVPINYHRTPVMVTVQNVLWLSGAHRREAGARGRALRHLTRRSARRAAVVTAPSKVAADIYAAATGASADRIVVAPYGLSVNVDLPPEVNPDTGRCCLFVVGEAQYKGMQLARRSIAVLLERDPALRIVVVGAAWDDAPGQVTVLPWADRMTVLKLMSQATVTVVPSLVESFGYAGIEAAAMGSPVVLVEGTAMTELLGPIGSALVSTVPPSGDRIAGAVASLMAPNGPDREVLAGRTRQAFSWEARIGRWLEAYALAARR